MSNLNTGVGGGINFNGPIALSGEALSKKYILQTMDNYMSFMSDMLNLFKEDITAYSKATKNAATYESNQISKQATADLVSGFATGVSGVLTGGMALIGGGFDASKLGEADAAGKESSNFDDVHNSLNDAESEALKEAPPAANHGQAGVGPAGFARDPDTETNIRNLESGDKATYEEFRKNGKRGAGVGKAKEAIKNLVREKRVAGANSPAGKQAQRRIDSIKDRFKEKKKVADNNKQSIEGRVTHSSQKRMQYSQALQSLSQSASSFAKYGTTVGSGGQANAKKQSTYAQSNQQLNQQLLSSTQGQAKESAQKAQDLVQLERQIQANNITRG